MSPLTIGLGQIQPFKVCKVSIFEEKKEKIMFEGNNYRVLGNCGPKVLGYCSENMSASDILSLLGAHQMWSI